MSVKPFISVAAIAAVSVGFAQSSASANVILTIDITNPTAVVFTGTTAPALVSSTQPGGALLAIGALSTPAPMGLGQFGAQTLASTASGGLYNFLFTLSGSSTFSIGVSGTTTQSFVAGQRALSGTWVGNFSFVPFAAPGTIGDLAVRDSLGTNTGIVVGQYQIIPAPGAAALLGLGGLMVSRRRR